jgi:hypothetical protein
MTKLRPLDPHAALRAAIAVCIGARPQESKATVLCGFAKSNRMITSLDIVQRVFDEVWAKRA